VSYRYDAAGRVARKDLGNGVYSTYQYDHAGQVIHLINYAAGGTILARYDYSYDTRGRRISMATSQGVWKYHYDDRGQLTRAMFDSSSPSVADQDLTFTYDLVGNRVRTVENAQTMVYTTNAMNQYTRIGDTTYEFDADGNLAKEISPQGTVTYTFND